MNRKDAIAKGVNVCETKHSMKRRSPWHDYHGKGIYMLTLAVEGRVPLLGRLEADGNKAKVVLSPLGRLIKEREIKKISLYYPQVEVWKLCIMPDHIHMIVRVREDMGNGKHLGQVVRGFKTGCSRAWWETMETNPVGNVTTAPVGNATGTKTAAVPPSDVSVPPSGVIVPSSGVSVPSVSPEGVIPSQAAASPKGRSLPLLFEPGYNDKLLLREGQLDTWKAYLDDNPRRLLLKRRNPQLFTVLSDMDIAGRKCQIVGNRFLLDIPDKVAVIVHRRYTDEENARLREEWLACGERGGVLVSAAISRKEKEVMREAMDRGYRIILLRENGFPEYYKPSGESFYACSEGLLLQVSPWDYHMEQRTISRAQCLFLNDMAEKLTHTYP